MKQLLLLSTLLLFQLLSCSKESEKANKDENVKGCGDFFVAKIIAEDKALTVWIDSRKIKFSTQFQSFEDIATEDFAQLKVEQSCDIDAIWYGICNDALQSSPCEVTKWSLQKGKLSFKVNKIPTQPACSNRYLATVILENTSFVNDRTGEILFLEKEEIKNVEVGFCVG